MFNQEKFIIGVIIGMIVLIYIYMKEQEDLYRLEEILKSNKTEVKTNAHEETCNNCSKDIVEVPVHLPPRVDVVGDYDYRKIVSPLEQPVRRVPRHWIPPAHIKNMIDIPTRGYPDTFHQIGLLTREGEGENDNRVIRLMGRETYPGSGRYEYYTRISSGNEVINLPIETKRNIELYTDDKININELDSEYKVKIFDYDAPKYYPDIL
jgi:hypothetical protein